MSAQTVQLNIRLDAQVKNSADARIKRAGYSPTQFFRLLWEALALPESNENTVNNILAAAMSSHAHVKTESDNRAHAGAHYIEESLRKQGVSISSLPTVNNSAQAKDAYMTERYGVCEL